MSRIDTTVRIFKTGELIEGYRVLSEIGRGAASVVYLAQDPKTKQIWALKHVTRGEAKDNRFLEQAEHEYNIAAQLDHPNIRRFEKLIRKKEGFLSAPSEIIAVMELVDGTSVDREPPRTFEQAAEIFEQVARGLAYMHSRGFVHADMKPNNVIVDATGKAKIIDLGQSCAMNTVKKRIQGTPDYIAPEQVHRRPITHKTDIYNLGATMYWALTRRFVPTALGKQDSLVGSLDDALMPKPQPCTAFNARVPEYLNELIMSCVEIEPALRPETMNVVADRLNLVKARLLAEAEMRKSGSFRRVLEDTDAEGRDRSKAGSRDRTADASKADTRDLNVDDDNEASGARRATA
jgi:serine/threonine-protein kinase